MVAVGVMIGVGVGVRVRGVAIHFLGLRSDPIRSFFIGSDRRFVRS